ncbi:MAG: hypothetical protein BGP04_20705 [Rhizobiales bacterium 62-17]|nr:hypothetical protein [Hyphomicrobiales bacterium]OJY00050.1 MAG: hypothetical protein BGP04_20705 [Rhizobiales bacterium 62-17]
MTGEKINFDEAVEAASSGDKSNDRSTIAFPYLDLDTAVEVARAVYSRAGRGACELDGLAAEMGQTVSGAFRLKTGTARIFGLVEKDGRDSLRLTTLGQRVVTEDERGGRVDAFLAVPLYSRIFDSYRGTLLPPAKALEREMQALGVAPKQADKARQAFERSARQAGFFEAGEGRLVKPKLENAEKRLDPSKTDNEAVPENTLQREPSRKGGGGGGESDLHPFIQGLLKTLPAASTTEMPSEWSMRERAKWLKTAASIFGLIYTDEGGGEIEISVKDDR